MKVSYHKNLYREKNIKHLHQEQEKSILLIQNLRQIFHPKS